MRGRGGKERGRRERERERWEKLGSKTSQQDINNTSLPARES